MSWEGEALMPSRGTGDGGPLMSHGGADGASPPSFVGAGDGGLSTTYEGAAGVSGTAAVQHPTGDGRGRVATSAAHPAAAVSGGRLLRDREGTLFWPSDHTTPPVSDGAAGVNSPAGVNSLAGVNSPAGVNSLAGVHSPAGVNSPSAEPRVSPHCSWCKCQACAFCAASGLDTGGGLGVRSFVGGYDTGGGAVGRRGGGANRTDTRSGGGGGAGAGGSGGVGGDGGGESRQRLVGIALAGAAAGLLLLLCGCACCPGDGGGQRRYRRGYGRTRVMEEALLPCVVSVNGGATHALALDVEGVRAVHSPAAHNSNPDAFALSALLPRGHSRRGLTLPVQPLQPLPHAPFPAASHPTPLPAFTPTTDAKCPRKPFPPWHTSRPKPPSPATRTTSTRPCCPRSLIPSPPHLSRRPLIPSTPPSPRVPLAR
eukprot:scaffold36337_cov118-Isochrysis_galbana.AAC.4